MADSKASAFPTTASAVSGDYVPLITGIGTTPANKVITVSNLQAGLATTSALTSGLAGKANTSHTHTVSDISATGTADATTYLRGDGSWSAPAGGGGTPAFAGTSYANTIGGSFTSGATVPFDTKLAGDSLSSNTWTCVTTGYYRISFQIDTGLDSGATLNMQIRKGSTIQGGSHGAANVSATRVTGTHTLILSLTAGDVIKCTATTGSTSFTINTAYFSVNLVGV